MKQLPFFSAQFTAALAQISKFSARHSAYHIVIFKNVERIRDWWMRSHPMPTFDFTLSEYLTADLVDEMLAEIQEAAISCILGNKPANPEHIATKLYSVLNFVSIKPITVPHI